MIGRVIFFLLVVFSLNAVAQNKAKRFKMPLNAEFERGRVMVKIKEEFKDEVAQMARRNARTQLKNVALNSVSHLVKPELNRKGASRMGARAQSPSVDISKYFSLTFNADQNVEEYINQLYSTGYFEIVEPEYKVHSFFTPSDPSVGQQYHLNLIKAFEAWDITKGDTSIVIAIVDSGGNLTHSDIAPNLYRNWKEYPPNGVDDDGNGFIDDYQGWDFVGSTLSNLDDPNFIGDNNPAISKGGDISHGTWSAGCASAATNNGKGIAGVGFNTKLLFTKHTADDQKTDDGSVNDPYSGMLYAANMDNVRIINCSFGGSGRSQIVQDLINYIVLDRNCLVVAAAGNDNSSSPSYPASYDNVLSVAATDQSDKRASFSNYGNTVDIAAPGVGIYTTGYNNVYNTESGTSFSSPIAAGAAALVWAKNPTYTALQVVEQLRVSADGTALYKANPNFIQKLGKGRLDIHRALTLDLPSVRALNPKFVNKDGSVPAPGEKAYLSFDFKNYLRSTSNGIQISISTTSTLLSISKSKITPGVIAGSATVSNELTPFEMTVNSGAGANKLVDLLITYSDGVYSDYQYVSFNINPSFIDVDLNLIKTTVTGIGRIGFQDTEALDQGIGFIFDNNSMLYEMGLIMGTDSINNLYNNVRGISTSGFDQDFFSTAFIKKITPGQRSSSEIYGEFSNSVSSSAQAVVVGYRSMVMDDAPYDKFVILEYKVKNPKASALNNFYFGIFSDWDISTNGQHDVADWDSNNKMGYVYPAIPSKPYAGVQLLTGPPAYYAIDNDSSKAGKNSFGIYDGFTDGKKFKTISAAIGSGRERLQTAQPNGDDVSQVVSSGPYTINAGETITIAFALHAAANFSDLQTSARYADSLYNYTMLASVPSANSDSVCYNTQAILNASGANSIKWYNKYTGGQSLFTGPQYTTGNLTSDTTFYVSNADHTYESVRTPIKVKVKANPKIFTSGSTALCNGDALKLSVTQADSTIWSTGQKTNTIEISTAGKFAVLSKDNEMGCVSKSDTINVFILPKPMANFTVSGDLETGTSISFTDQSTDAIAWFWDFGNGEVSLDQNPVHNYTIPSNFVMLTVTASDGCKDTKTSSIKIITAIEDLELSEIKIYPNPVSTQDLQIVIDNDNLNQSHLAVTNSLGQIIFERDISTTETHVGLTIPSTTLNQGLNIVRVNVGGKTIVRKVMKVQ